jgi:TPR repeat protein
MVEGEGGETDINGAVEWFTKAALRGEVDSQFNLALLLLSRADQNPDALGPAYYWLLIAAESGDATAAEKAEEVAGLMSAELAGALRAEAAAFKAIDR